MKIKITGHPKTTKKNNKKWINVEARFSVTRDFCNITGSRVGDLVKLEINKIIFTSKVSDFVTIPSSSVFSEKEIKQIKNGTTLRKIVDLEILDIQKKEIKFDINDSFVAILAHLFSDGCITTRKIHFTNTEKESTEHFKILFNKCFPQAVIREWLDENIRHIQIDNIEAVSILSRMIDIFGRKSVTNPHVPQFIRNDIFFSKVWLSHVFSDEGWINRINNTVCISRQVRFKNKELVKSLKWEKKGILKGNFHVITADLNEEQLKLVPKNNLINDEAEMLKELGINLTMSLRKGVHLIDEDISATWGLFVRASNFIGIGFCNSRKQKQLEMCCQAKALKT